jgi:phosphoserine phosphatase
MNKKLLVLDVEGTIFQAMHPVAGMEYASTMWQSIANSLGDEACRRELELGRKWEAGQYKNYLEWVEETYIWIHKELGLKKEIFDGLINDAEYIPGVKDFFKALNRQIYISVLVSGGFQELVRKAQKELGIDHGHGACEYFFDHEDWHLVSRSVTPCDFTGKYAYIEHLFRQYDLDPKADWIFIGDGKNDCDIAKRAPISIAINGHEELKKVVKFSTDKRGNHISDFYQIKEIIDSLTAEDFQEASDGLSSSHKLFSDAGQEKDTLKKANEKIVSLQIENKRLKQKNNDLRGRNKKPKERKYRKQWLTNKTPKLLLSEILTVNKVVFVGLKEEYEQFAFLKYIHENLLVIPAGSENHDFKAYKNVDFLFVFKDCISHTLVKKAINELKVPYIFLPPQRDKDLLNRIMTNALIAEFGL